MSCGSWLALLGGTFMVLYHWNQSSWLSQCLVTRSCMTLCDPTTVAHQAPPSMGDSQARILEGLPAMLSSMPSYWVLNRGLLLLGWQMAAFVGFLVLSSTHIPVDCPYTSSWSSALTLLKEEEAVPPSLPDVSPLQPGLFRDLTDISTTFSSHPWKYTSSFQCIAIGPIACSSDSDSGA